MSTIVSSFWVVDTNLSSPIVSNKSQPKPSTWLVLKVKPDSLNLIDSKTALSMRAKCQDKLVFC